MQVKIAKTYWMRLFGLMGRQLDNDEALLIPDCRQVHAFFMREPIEIIFLDSAQRILSIHILSPWRVSPHIKGTFSILEMPVGGSKQANLKVGDKLDFSL